MSKKLKGLEYVHKTPKFLEQLSQKVERRNERLPYNDGQDEVGIEEDEDDILNGEDAPQIVVLKKRHLTREQTELELKKKDEKSEKEDIKVLKKEPMEEPFVDESGRILFKQNIKLKEPLKSKKRLLRNSEIETSKIQSKSSRKKTKVALSFDVED